MAEDAPRSPHEPRLNPFVLPSDTDLRFVLLIVSVLGASLFTYNWLYYELFGSTFQEAARRCLLSSAAAYDGGIGDLSGISSQTIAQNQALAACLEPAEQAQFLWIISGVTLVLILAGAIYWTMPALKIRRDRLVPLTDERAPGVGAYLRELCREAGLSRPPAFLVNPHNPSASGLAFGRRGKRYVSLNVGLVMRYYADRPAFRAVVLHELAHLRNADVGKTYFSVAVGIAFAIAALAPFGVDLVYSLVRAENPGAVLGLSWRVLALAALVYLTLAAVLRAREVYADVWASVWDGPSGALGKALNALTPPKGGRFRALLRVHPDPGERRRALAETDRLFRMGFWDAFGTGVAAMVAVPILTLVLGMAIPSRQENWAPIAAALLFAPLAMGVVGVGIWRDSFAARARDQASRRVIRLALALGLGVMLGQALALDSVATPTPATANAADQTALTFYPIFNLVLGGLLLIGLSCFLWWISVGASAWLEGITTHRSLRRIASVGLITAGLISAVLLGSLLWWFTIGPDALVLFAAPNLLAVVIALLQSPLALLVFVGLWAFPLAARLWQGRTAQPTEMQWAFLDAPPQPLRLRRRDRFRLPQALVTGTFGGLAFCALLLVVQFGWNAVPGDVRTTDQARIAFAAGQVAVAVLLQATTAAIVAIRVRWLGGIHGLFAAFVAGCVMAVGILGLNLAFGGSITPSFAWTIFSLVVNGGALLSLPVAAGLSALASRFQSDHPTPQGDQDRFQPAPGPGEENPIGDPR